MRTQTWMIRPERTVPLSLCPCSSAATCSRNPSSEIKSRLGGSWIEVVIEGSMTGERGDGWEPGQARKARIVRVAFPARGCLPRFMLSSRSIDHHVSKRRRAFVKTG